jgi:Ca-activated chloride channel family protein
MKISTLEKITSLLLPVFFLSLFPRPSDAVPWLEGKAVIKSCKTVEKKEATRPVYKMSAPAGGAGTGFMPKPMEAAPSTMILPSPPYPPQPPRAQPARDKGSLDLHQAGKKVDKEIRKASTLYLSNDDSMSLASAQRLIYAIDNFLPLYRNEIRPHEFLNYFHFATDPVTGDQPFSVNFQMAPRENGETLALAVQGKKLTNQQRRPAVITLILDKSGSMEAQGKMEYLKEGMKVLKSQFKDGDVINVVEFDHETCSAIEGFVVGRDDWKGYQQTVAELAPRGSTDLHKGLVEGYKLAEKYHQPGSINRVILITDAIANTGELSPDLMASIGKYYDTQKIALSGIGVGLDFNDELLDTLTEKGKGAYLFLGIKAAIPRVFGEDFISLLETVARNVHFQATFPKDLHLDIFYGEEVSTEKEKVQPIHYFANSSQLFLLDLAGAVKEANSQFSLKIEYEDPISGAQKEQALSRSVGQIKESGGKNVAKARLIMAFASLMEKTANEGDRPYSGWSDPAEPSGKEKKEGKKLCGETLTEMDKLQAESPDQESQYVLGLTQKYCSRF